MALAAQTRSSDVHISWIYNGRVGKLEKDLVGLVIKDIDLWIRLLDEMTLSDFLRTIVKKIKMGMTYYDYDYRIIEEGNQVVSDDIVCVIYQSNLLEFNTEGRLKYQIIDLPNKYGAAENIIDVELRDGDIYPRLDIKYNSALYNVETIDSFKKMIVKSALRLAEYADKPETKIMTLINERKPNQ